LFLLGAALVILCYNFSKQMFENQGFFEVLTEINCGKLAFLRRCVERILAHLCRYFQGDFPAENRTPEHASVEMLAVRCVF